MTYRGAILDVDGTLVRGDKPIPGAREGVAALRAAGCDLLLFSNNPTGRPADYDERLAPLGIDVERTEGGEREDPAATDGACDRRSVPLLTSGTVTAAYLAREHPDEPTFVVGEPDLRELIGERGTPITEDHDGAAVVVGSFDSGFTYDRLTAAFRALQDDETVFLGTDPDMTIPHEDGLVPGSGAIINAVGGVADRDPERILGKPSPVATRAALDRIGHPPEDCLVVGDRLDTDLAMGERAGMTTALVLTGVSTREDVAASAVTPDYVLDSLGDIDTVLDDG